MCPHIDKTPTKDILSYVQHGDGAVRGDRRRTRGVATHRPADSAGRRALGTRRGARPGARNRHRRPVGGQPDQETHDGVAVPWQEPGRAHVGALRRRAGQGRPSAGRARQPHDGDVAQGVPAGDEGDADPAPRGQDRGEGRAVGRVQGAAEATRPRRLARLLHRQRRGQPALPVHRSALSDRRAGDRDAAGRPGVVRRFFGVAGHRAVRDRGPAVAVARRRPVRARAAAGERRAEGSVLEPSRAGQGVRDIRAGHRPGGQAADADRAGRAARCSTWTASCRPGCSCGRGC